MTLLDVLLHRVWVPVLPYASSYVYHTPTSLMQHTAVGHIMLLNTLCCVVFLQANAGLLSIFTGTATSITGVNSV